MPVSPKQRLACQLESVRYEFILISERIEVEEAPFRDRLPSLSLYSSSNDKKIIRLEIPEAPIWLNEVVPDQSSFQDFADYLCLFCARRSVG